MASKKLFQSAKPFPQTEAVIASTPFSSGFLSAAFRERTPHTSAGCTHKTSNMSLTMTVAQQLLLRVRKKRQKHSFCGLEAFLGQAHVHVQVRTGKDTFMLMVQPAVGANRLLSCQLAGGDLCDQPCFSCMQEDNTPQEQVLITTTAHQAITGGVCLSQGFWAFYGVSPLAQGARAPHVGSNTARHHGCWFGCTRLALQQLLIPACQATFLPVSIRCTPHLNWRLPCDCLMMLTPGGSTQPAAAAAA